MSETGSNRCSPLHHEVGMILGAACIVVGAVFSAHNIVDCCRMDRSQLFRVLSGIGVGLGLATVLMGVAVCCFVRI